MSQVGKNNYLCYTSNMNTNSLFSAMFLIYSKNALDWVDYKLTLIWGYMPVHSFTNAYSYMCAHFSKHNIIHNTLK